MDVTFRLCAIMLPNQTLHQRRPNNGLRSERGIELWIYINNDWCTNHTAVESYCSPNPEYLLLNLRQFYLPWEISVVIVAVYIPPQANAKQALAQLHSSISKQQDAHPDSAFIAAGDFNHVNLRSVIQKFLWEHAAPYQGLKHSGSSVHKHQRLIQSFPQPSPGTIWSSFTVSNTRIQALIHKTKPAIKTVKIWPEEATLHLHDCSVPSGTCLHIRLPPAQRWTWRNTATVLFYITMWKNKEVQNLWKACSNAFKSGDATADSHQVKPEERHQNRPNTSTDNMEKNTTISTLLAAPNTMKTLCLDDQSILRNSEFCILENRTGAIVWKYKYFPYSFLLPPYTDPDLKWLKRKVFTPKCTCVRCETKVGVNSMYLDRCDLC